VGQPGCTGTVGYNGYKPFLGIAAQAGTPTAEQLASIIATSVGQPAVGQLSLIDSTTMVGNPKMNIVTAGDPMNSFMMYKLDGSFPTTPTNGNEVTCSTLACVATMTCGEAMPNGGPALSSTTRDTIRRWIAQGAKNN
jgi:hypothetical protein